MNTEDTLSYFEMQAFIDAIESETWTPANASSESSTVKVQLKETDDMAGLSTGKTVTFVKPKRLTVEDIGTAYDYAYLFQQLHPGYDCFVTTLSTLKMMATQVGDMYTGMYHMQIHFGR